MTNFDEKLIGRTVKEIWMNEDYLTFVTENDHGFESRSYEVEGDCCSHSYFYDFYGVANVLGREVVAFEEVKLAPGDPGYRPETFEVASKEWEETQVYGYRITTEHPQFGHVSAVFSFRNDSNGYYGGWMNPLGYFPGYEPEHQLFVDKIGS